MNFYMCIHMCVTTVQISPQHAPLCSLPVDSPSKVSMILTSVELDWFYLFVGFIEMKSYGIYCWSWAFSAYHCICEIRL